MFYPLLQFISVWMNTFFQIMLLFVMCGWKLLGIGDRYYKHMVSTDLSVKRAKLQNWLSATSLTWKPSVSKWADFLTGCQIPCSAQMNMKHSFIKKTARTKCASLVERFYCIGKFFELSYTMKIAAPGSPPEAALMVGIVSSVVYPLHKHRIWFAQSSWHCIPFLYANNQRFLRSRNS